MSAGTSGEPARIRVALGDRSYDVLIGQGLLAQSGALIAERVGTAKCAVVTDANVAQRHLATLRGSSDRPRSVRRREVLAPGEATKSFAVLARLSERLLEMGLERGDLVVALGGGVIGDLAGFAASILRRGIRFVQIPTTLLAQVDSSVGGKTGINTPQGKNLVGAFHQPSLVLADTDALATLPLRAVPRRICRGRQVRPARRCGLLRLARAELAGGVRPRCSGADPRACHQRPGQGRHRRARRDRNRRPHAAQPRPYVRPRAGGLGRLLRPAPARRSRRHRHVPGFPAVGGTGALGNNSVARVEAHFAALGLPTWIADIPGGQLPDAATLVQIMGQDKKVRQGQLTLILARGIGEAFITRDVPRDKVLAFLAREIAPPERAGGLCNPAGPPFAV